VVADHYPEGGVGEAVVGALTAAGQILEVRHLAVRGLPGSGMPAELMEAAGISVDDVVGAARSLLGE
jgi:transketolase